MCKSLCSRRKELGEEHIADLVRLLGGFAEIDLAKVTRADGEETCREILHKDAMTLAPTEDSKVRHAPIARIVGDTSFGYRMITVERSLLIASDEVMKAGRGKNKGKPMPDTAQRDTENVPLHKDVDAWFEREARPHEQDAWIDHDKTKFGYEIPSNRPFYVFKPPRPLDKIDTELKAITDRIKVMIAGLVA